MTDTATIYMQILNEGTDCWRPVEATPLGGDLFRIESRCDTDDEEWEFPSGAVVRGGPQKFSGGVVHLTALAIATPPASDQPSSSSDQLQ